MNGDNNSTPIVENLTFTTKLFISINTVRTASIALHWFCTIGDAMVSDTAVCERKSNLFVLQVRWMHVGIGSKMGGLFWAIRFHTKK